MYAESFTAVQRFCYYKTPSISDGDDIIQEVALAAWSNRESLKNTDAFKGWLLKIASNKCNDFYRKRAAQFETTLDTADEVEYYHSRYGLTTSDAVEETLELLSERDAQILGLFYIERLPQAEIARRIGIPIGTVKSRLNAAKKRFRALYPYPPETKGVILMKELPEILPEYNITRLDVEPFSVKWEENLGFFFVPRLGEKLSWAMYDRPGGKRSEVFDIEVVGRASVHGVEGVEVISKERNAGNADHMNANCVRTFIAQLTDTHCRLLSETHIEDDVKYTWTFLDADEFIPNWGFGEDNCGKEINIRPKGIVRRDGHIITTDRRSDLLDVVGRYAVTIGGKEYDCVCVMDVAYYNPGVVSEQFVDRNGRTILWRRFNRDDWKLERYKQPWSERLPDSDRLTVNGELYVHWYDCITDYIL